MHDWYITPHPFHNKYVCKNHGDTYLNECGHLMLCDLISLENAAQETVDDCCVSAVGVSNLWYLLEAIHDFQAVKSALTKL